MSLMQNDETMKLAEIRVFTEIVDALPQVKENLKLFDKAGSRDTLSAAELRTEEVKESQL